jgi:hypothetical protein
MPIEDCVDAISYDTNFTLYVSYDQATWTVYGNRETFLTVTCFEYIDGVTPSNIPVWFRYGPIFDTIVQKICQVVVTDLYYECHEPEGP